MPKENERTDAGEMLGGYEQLIGALAKSDKQRDALTKLITEDGPPHKQWQHTLVLSRLAELITFAEEATDTTFEPLSGPTLKSGEHTLPLAVPSISLEMLDADDDLAGKVSGGPAHEVAYTAVLLQGIEWLINTLFEEEGEDEEDGEA